MNGDGSILFFTLKVALGSTALVFFPGLAVAYLLSLRRLKGRAFLDALVNLPLVLPATAVGLLLLMLLGREGVVGRHLHAWFGWDIVFTWRAVIVATACMAFPLFVRSARTAFEEVDERLPAMARSLGRGPFGAFFAVQLPLAWRGILAGVVLAFSRALGEFGATILVAGNIPGRTQTLATALFQRVQVGDDAAALRLAGIAALVAFCALFVAERLGRRRDRELST